MEQDNADSAESDTVKNMEKDGSSSMRIRILSGAVGIIVAMLALMFNKAFPLCINIAISIISLLCTIELLNAKKLTKNIKIAVPCMLFAAAAPMLVTAGLWHIILFLFTLALVAVMIFSCGKIKFQDIAFVYTTVFIATAGLSSIVALCDLDRAHTAFNVTMCLIIPWGADAGAYFIGSFFGKRKLCPSISPKKTVEGAIGGIVIGILAALGDAFVFKTWLFHGTEQIHYINIFIVALVGTLISIIGDLSFSLIKRSCDVKDYGNVIPGHGGILDRFDSVIFTAPLVFFFVQYFPIMTMG